MRIYILRSVGQIARYVLLGAAFLYVADSSVFEVRLARGAGLGSVLVEQYLQTPLKGHRLEYDYLGTAYENCSRTVFPQYAAARWNPPCWWLKRHNQHWR
jgi:hypothetical protein